MKEKTLNETYRKKEALQRKKAVKTGTASPKEFTDWLYQQSNVIIELCEIWL